MNQAPPGQENFDIQFGSSLKKQRKAFLGLRSAGSIKRQPLSTTIIDDLQQLKDGQTTLSGLSSGRSGMRIKLRHVFWDLRKIWLRASVAAVLGRLALLAAVWSVSKMFDQYQGISLAIYISLGFAVFQLVGIASQYFADLMRGQLAIAAQLHLLTKINFELRRRDYEGSPAFNSGNLKTLIISDLQYLGEFTASLVWNGLPTLFTLVILGPVIYYMAGITGLIGILVSVAYVPLAVLLTTKLEREQRKAQTHLDRLSSAAGEWLKNVRLARLLNWQQSFEKQIYHVQRDYLKAFVMRHSIACVIFGISFGWWMVPLGTMLIYARLMDVPLDLKSLFASLWVIRDLSEYLRHLPYTISLYASASTCMQRTNQLESLKMSRIVDAEQQPTPPSYQGMRTPAYLHFRSVSLQRGDTHALQNLNCTIDLNCATAIIGSVGAGKSSIIKLILGMLHPSAGEILVEDTHGNTHRLHDAGILTALHDHVAYVPQEPYVSSATIAENIAMFTPHVREEDVMHAAALAEFESEINLMADGSRTKLGETGVNLSGGQRQRLNIARAFISKRPIFVLDDPLSAVDADTEIKLVEHFLDYCKGFVLVTHRIQHLDRFDRIMVLEQGAVIEYDSPKRLSAIPDSAYNRYRQAANIN